MAPLGVAILGSGIFVNKEHKPAALQNPELLSLKAVYSRSRASVLNTLTANEQTTIDIYSDDSGDGKGIDDLLKREDISFVIIALPITLQVSFIKKALLAGKHVLSEKPIAKDLADANELIKWKKANVPNLLWGVAENFRFQELFDFAKEKVQEFGRVLTFHVDVLNNTLPGGSYFETPWRKVPEYQGGYCLDGGVHFTAALRKLVGEDQISNVSAFTALVQPYLPPIDTIMATVRLKSGVCGTFGLTFGSLSAKAFEWMIICQEGSVKVVDGGKVIVKRVGVDEEEVKEFEGDERSGVRAEVRAFAESIVSGKANPSFSPELAIGDLEMIEKMLKSGESNGQPLEITGGLEN